VTVGAVYAFSSIGVEWSKLQWLVAALGVGLGFGLQEIVANFVSGIILLIERPIRVGDIVTVGGADGTVSRIRIRATSIMTWDRKELLVPNKALITGEVVNWTLSDAVLRVRIPVGIAYGSDTEKARDLLLGVARANESVLDDPAPTALFRGFGDSTLDFELRVFIPSIEHLIPVKSALFFAIDAAFREAGIEIAFPQRDLHVRSISGPIKVETVSREELGLGEPTA